MASTLGQAMEPDERAAALTTDAEAAAGCLRCGLHEGRTQVVFGEGSTSAVLMLVGEAPGFHEDRLGSPFAGQAAELIERLLADIELSRDDVYLTTVLKCRPPGNRDPLAAEIAACEPYLFRQLELVRPQVVASLGNFATQLLTGRSHGITTVHGQPQELVIGGESVVVLPLYHPAAALYTPATLAELEADFARIPVLLGRAESQRAKEEEPCLAAVGGGQDAAAPAEPALQLGLF
jgi:uracil-DNA glycosylase